MMTGQKQTQHTMQVAPAGQHVTKAMMPPLYEVCATETLMCVYNSGIAGQSPMRTAVCGLRLHRNMLIGRFIL